MKKSDIGMVGLSVMGSNLAMNMAGKGFCVSVYNYTADLTEKFLSGAAKGKENIQGFFTLEEFVRSLESPRKVSLMIRAGKPVDEMIEKLLPLLDRGDIIIDGGNSHFADTARRTAYVESQGLLYIGTGVSGGEEGALNGPSMMPGGSPAAWPAVKPILQAICAKVADGTPCCDWVGENGAGHFVKMVHNGIEYGDMQLICEAYHLMRDAMGMSNAQMSALFGNWNGTELNSYLIEITSAVLDYREESGYTVDRILDAAGQKGTGKWTGIAALEEGVPLTLISEAVFARCLSARKDERTLLAERYPKTAAEKAPDTLKEDLRRALYAAKILSYTQGYDLMRSAAATYGWRLNYDGIALMWRGGCIIRSAFLGKIKEAYDRNPELGSLLEDDYFASVLRDAVPSLRRVVAYAVMNGIPMPAFSAALSFFDGSTCASLPANLLQAQRDYFGAHTYERTDTPRGQFFHTDWTGHGGDTSSTSYNV